MKVIADLHIHGKYSRATSKDLTFKNLEKYGAIKGLNLIGTGDFTHPEWIKEISKLEDRGDGIFGYGGMNFVLQTEISLVYTQDGRGRRIHNLIFSPDIDTCKQITDYLLTKGRVDYDGRPIFKIPSYELVENLKKINSKIEIVPAHIWTPHFSLFGQSGFNSVEECFKDQAKHIFALETGLSSDPAMNHRLSQLDKYTLISNSDSHGFWPWRIGRECNVLNLKKLSYNNLMNSLKTREGFEMTIEVDPGYGKYHFDGHRKCNVCMNPSKSIKVGNICPVCKKKLTFGVLHRVEELADRPEGYVLKGAVPYKTLLPLAEVIAWKNGIGVSSKKNVLTYNKLIEKFGNEMNILLGNIDEGDSVFEKVVDKKIASAIVANREEKLNVKPGYDGEYGEIVK